MTPSERLREVVRKIAVVEYKSINSVIRDLESIAAEIEKAPQCGVAVEVADNVFKELCSRHANCPLCAACAKHENICETKSILAAYRSARDAAKGAR